MQTRFLKLVTVLATVLLMTDIASAQTRKITGVVVDEMGVPLDLALSLEVEDAAIEARMSGLRVCEGCGASYHIVNIPPKTEGVCDKCGGHLVQREDDKPETVQNRLAVYHKETEPLKDFYAERGNLICVEGQEEVADTTALVFKALKPFEA